MTVKSCLGKVGGTPLRLASGAEASALSLFVLVGHRGPVERVVLIGPLER